MAVVALLDPEVGLVVRAGALVAVKKDQMIQSIPLHEVTEVQLHGRSHLSPDARLLLLREGIDVAFFSGNGDYLGRMTGGESKAARRRLGWYALVSDPQRRVALARSVVAGKIHNQRAVLLKRQLRLRDEEVGGALARLRGLAAQAQSTPAIDQLLGVEGMAANVYFGVFGRTITNPAFRFEGRNRRPPRDPVNALLSFGYALLVSNIEKAVREASLDPYIGVLHDGGRGAPSLALDLAEEGRPVVDSLVLTLVNRRQLTPEDFRTPLAEEMGESAELAEGSPAVYLGEVARQVLLRAWERRLDERSVHPLSGEQWGLRALFTEQARQIARIADGEAQEYRPLELER